MKINNLAGLRRETERLEYKLQVDKSKLKTEFQLLRFQLIEFAIKEVLGIFKKSNPEMKESSNEKEKSGKDKEEPASAEKKSQKK